MKSKREQFTVSFTPALIPERMTGTAIVEHEGGRATYQSLWADAGTAFPLAAWSRAGKTLLAGAGSRAGGRHWLTDLDVVKSPNMIAVRAHGDDRGKMLAVQTAWFLHLRGHPDEIWIHQRLETRRAPLAWEIAAPSSALRAAGIGVTCARRGKRVGITAPVGERWTFRLAAGKQPAVAVSVEVLPPENDRGFVDHRGPLTLTVELHNTTVRALRGGSVAVYGLPKLVSAGVDLPARGSVRVELPLEFDGAEGIVPVAVRFEHPDGVGLGTRTLWVPKVILQTDQPWLDGMYAENLRSMVHRFTFNTWREDEPRYPCYRDGVFDRNIHTALIAMDRPRRLWGWIRLWLMSLRSCGYMPEAYGLVPPPLRDAAWLAQPYQIGNDGTGFTLMQWGKLFLRADEALRRDMLDHDLADLMCLARYVGRSLHRTGQIDDHSEPVDGIATEQYVVGSPYAQALCLAGALLVRRALDEAASHARSHAQAIATLAALYADLAKRLRAGLDVLSRKDGQFADITNDQNQRHPHTYTNLAPGMFLTDPDLGDEGYSEWDVLRQTVAFNAAYHPEGRPFRVLTCPYWPPHPGLSHHAYAQIGMIVNCLGLGLETEAGQYLDELIASVKSDSTKHRISDPDYTVRDWNVKERDFARYIIPEGVLPGREDVKLNPGNGVNVSYFLYLIDRMIGITPRAGAIEIKPCLAGQKQWEVLDYPSRLGPVSYRLERSGDQIAVWCAAKVPVTFALPVREAPRTLAVDGEAQRKIKTSQTGAGRRLLVAVGAGEHTVHASNNFSRRRMTGLIKHLGTFSDDFPSHEATEKPEQGAEDRQPS